MLLYRLEAMLLYGLEAYGTFGSMCILACSSCPLKSKIAQAVQLILEFYLYWSGRRVTQKKDHLHQTGVARDGSRMREFVIDDPLRVIR